MSISMRPTHFLISSSETDGPSQPIYRPFHQDEESFVIYATNIISKYSSDLTLDHRHHKNKKQKQQSCSILSFLSDKLLSRKRHRDCSSDSPVSCSAPSPRFRHHGVDLIAPVIKKILPSFFMVSSKNKHQNKAAALADSPTPPINSSGCSGKLSVKSAGKSANKMKTPLQETGNGVMSPTGEREINIPACALLPQSSPIPAISNGLTTGEEIVSGKTRVELVRSMELGRTDLGLILAGGADKEDRLHVINIQPGSTAHRTDRILIGDYITAINGVSTMKLKQTEIMTLIGNSRHSIIFELQYRLCPSALSRPASPPRLHKGAPQVVDTGIRGPLIESKRTEISITRDPASGPTCGLVLRGGSRLDRERSCPIFVVQIRPGSSVHRDGGVRPGDRILAINGTDLAGLHLDDVYGMLADFHAQQSAMPCGPNHQPLPLRLLIEYDILKGCSENSGRPTSADEWIMEFCRQSGSDIGLSLSATYVDGRSCIVVEGVRPASFADRTGVIRAGDILLSINGQSVENKMPSDVMSLLKYGSVTSSTSTNPKLGSTLRLQFLRPPQPITQSFVGGGSLSSVNMNALLRPEAMSPAALVGGRGVAMSQSYHASLSTAVSSSGTGAAVAKRSATTVLVNGSTVDSGTTTATRATTTTSLGVPASIATPTMQPRGRVSDAITNSLMIPTTAAGSNNYGQPASTTNSMSRLRRRGSIGSVTSFSSTCSANGGYVFHSETMDVYIEATSVSADCQPACGGLGASFGISFQKSSPGFATPATGTIGRSTLYNATSSKNCLTISAIEYGSAADRIGLLQEGDRVLQINGHSLANKRPEIATQLLHDSGPVCQLRVEFDVADSFAISNGVFHVRLPNRGPSLGLAAVSIVNNSTSTARNYLLPNGNSGNGLQRIFVSDIRRGSVAYRCGNLLIGDEIISVNSNHVSSVVDLISNIQQAGDIVVLKIRRFSAHNQLYVVTYGVHFEIGDTALGIGLARTDNPFYPFIVTTLDEAGLAFRSGAVHMGDYLVAVNDLDLSGCSLQQLQDTLDSLPSDSLVVLRLCRVGGGDKPSGSDQIKSANKQAAAPTGPAPPGSGSGSQSHDGPGRSPSGASASDTSSGAGRSPTSNKDGGSTSSEHGGHVRSVDSAICSDALPVKAHDDHPHDLVTLSDLIGNSLSMSRQSCYDNLKLDPTSGDWIPSSSSPSSSNNRQLLAALESAIWEMDVAKLKDTTCHGFSGTDTTKALSKGGKTSGLLLAPSKSATLPTRNLSSSPRDDVTRESVMSRSHLATLTTTPTTAETNNNNNGHYSSICPVRPSKSFGMCASEQPITSKPPAQLSHILTAAVAPRPIYLAAEHFIINERPLSGSFHMTSATQTEESPHPQHAAITMHHSPALASVTSSSLLVSDDNTFDGPTSKQDKNTSKYIDDSPIPQESQTSQSSASKSPTDESPKKEAPLSVEESLESPAKSLPPPLSSPLSERRIKKSASTRSFRRIGDAILRRLFDRSNTSEKRQGGKKIGKSSLCNTTSAPPAIANPPLAL